MLTNIVPYNELQQMASTCNSDNTIEGCGIIKSLDS